MTRLTLPVVALIIWGVSASLFSYAQVSNLFSVSLVTNPSSPSPGDTIKIFAATPTLDKNSAVFSWYIDGSPKPDLSGPGKDSINITAGNAGSAIRIRVVVDSAADGSAEVSMTIRVSDLALTWFAQTRIPAWYRGKALPVPGSIVNIVAIPQITTRLGPIRPEDLIYTWGLNDDIKVLSGVGEQVFRIKTSDLPNTSHHIKLVVEDINKEVHREGELFIVPTNPRVVIYKTSPLGGVETRSASTFLEAPQQGLIDFQAEPFFFPVTSRGSLKYRWEVAGTEVAGDPGNPFILTLDTAQQLLKQLAISVWVDDDDALLPSASGSVTLNFP
ncbi:MAG: hypothetical protein HYW89_02590 [Candidatus Sungiibacteriota bacterium]|uniref:Uncharacterized protein n=1 Tax=Candidatus Sungiibacteriota bacterium TaxID=2750080 RepID=A0A7T5RIS9_9BACT|nr:MAG: hypothetical protein HYW89_02590 [Candidatus Sungbacteria bacterium]